MSAIKELADDEAARAEVENPDDEEAAEAEEEHEQPTPEPEPEQPGLTEVEAEREFKKLEKLATTYLPKALAITERLGMPVEMCPLCTFPGLAIPRQAHEVTSDVEAAVLGLIGKAQAPDFRASGEYERCTACDGWGDVLTGAQKEISRTAMCNACGGKGYKAVVQPFVSTISPPPNGFPGADVAYQPLPQGIPDAWGRPAGHPHWGRDPREIGV
jgi:hypothetical protein